MSKLNLVGERFGTLVVTEELKERNSKGEVVWLCQCDCGRITKVNTYALTSHHTKSCGHHDRLENTLYKQGLISNHTSYQALTRGAPSNNTSGYKNISKIKVGNKIKYKVAYSVAKKVYNVGKFDTLHEAQAALKESKEAHTAEIIAKLKIVHNNQRNG